MQYLTSETFLQNGKYKIERVLGQGGFGITYLATDTTTNASVAIKELFVKELSSRDEETLCITSSGSSDLMTNIRRKFLKESQMLKQLRHPNIVRVYESFEENGTAYYVMEYIDGISLEEHIRTKGALSELAAIATIKKVAKAVEYLHGRSINHLDIKPANILLRRSDKEVILIDFGTAKHYDYAGNATTLSPAAYSQGYAAIEQYEGEIQVFSPETDIYSLGATLYKMHSGITPPAATSIAHNELVIPSCITSAEISKTIKKAMLINKERRMHSIPEFLASIESSHTSYGRLSLILLAIIIGGILAFYVLRPETVEIAVTTTYLYDDVGVKAINGVPIIIDGKDTKLRTPATIKVRKGSHTILLESKNSKKYESFFTTDDYTGNNRTLAVQLQPKYSWTSYSMVNIFVYTEYSFDPRPCFKRALMMDVEYKSSESGTKLYRINHSGKTAQIEIGQYWVDGKIYNGRIKNWGDTFNNMLVDKIKYDTWTEDCIGYCNISL